MLQRIQALTSLLDSALAESEQQPQQPLPGLAVTFAATQVQVSAFLLPLKNMLLPSYQSSPHVCLLAAIQVHVFACLLPFNHTFLPCCHQSIAFLLDKNCTSSYSQTSRRIMCHIFTCLLWLLPGLVFLQHSFTRTLPLHAQSGAAQESAVGVSAARSSDDVQAAYYALLEQALSHLQLLGVESASAKHSKKKAQERLYALLEALAKVSIQYWQCQHQECLLALQYKI